VNGWLVPAGNPDALAEALADALRVSPERLAEMGQAGSEAVRANHDVRTEAEKLVALFTASARGTPAPSTVPTVGTQEKA
jgi:glycosyltransferase involved in cell wall biosynthesis